MRGRNGIAALTLLAGVASPVFAADPVHTYSLINASATRIDFADEAGHMAKNGFMTFNILTVLASGSVAYSMSEVSIHCASSRIATISNANYAANGSLLPTETLDTAPQPITPGTLGQALHLVICTGVDPYPRSKSIKGADRALAKARDLFATLQAAK